MSRALSGASPAAPDASPVTTLLLPGGHLTPEQLDRVEKLSNRVAKLHEALA